MLFGHLEGTFLSIRFRLPLFYIYNMYLSSHDPIQQKIGPDIIFIRIHSPRLRQADTVCMAWLDWVAP